MMLDRCDNLVHTLSLDRFDKVRISQVQNLVIFEVCKLLLVSYFFKNLLSRGEWIQTSLELKLLLIYFCLLTLSLSMGLLVFFSNLLDRFCKRFCLFCRSASLFPHHWWRNPSVMWLRITKFDLSFLESLFGQLFDPWTQLVVIHTETLMLLFYWLKVHNCRPDELSLLEVFDKHCFKPLVVFGVHLIKSLQLLLAQFI